MTDKQLHTTIDIREALKYTLDFAGTTPVKTFSRLCERLHNDSGEVSYQLRIARGIDSQVKLFIEAKTVLKQQCQRCLQPMCVDVDAESELVPVYNENDARTLDPEYDPLDLSGDPVTYADVLEDELLLALPQIPLHPPEECSVELPESVDEEIVEDKKENPFAVLQGMKDKKH